MAEGDEYDSVWIDVRGFRDPKSRTSHDGRHPDVVIPFSRHENFPLLVVEVKNIVQEKLKTGADIISICFWCDHGKHRSVAAATIFGHVLSSKLNAVRSRIRHLTQEMRCSRHWRTCKECWLELDSQPALLDVVAYCSQLWDEAA